MDINKNSFTFGFTIIMVIIVAALLSVAYIKLKPYQDRNIELEKKQNILSSVGIIVDRDNAAFGVYMGMKAAAMYRWGENSLEGKTILVQGVGHVGEYLVKYLSDEKANVLINDLNKKRLAFVAKEYDAKIIEGGNIYDLEIDIYAPCALGATLNTDTISRLKCEIVSGGANNQLEDEDVHANQLKEKGIIYTPDFLINAGGLINVYSEIKGFTSEQSLEKTKNIYNTTLEILTKAEQDGITTNQAAISIAEQRLIEKGK